MANSDSASPQYIALSGTGTGAAAGASASIQLAPDAINFGEQTVHVASNPWTINLSNTGGGDLGITSVSVSDPADFTVISDCPSTVHAYSSCNIRVAFVPSSTGPITGEVRVVDTLGTHTVALNGTGKAVESRITVSPAAIDFGTQDINTVSNHWTVTVSNGGSNDIPLSAFSIDPAGNFAFDSACGSTLAAHSTCNVKVTFAPTATGIADAKLLFTANGEPQGVTLHGNGQPPAAVVLFSPTSVDFSSVNVNDTKPWTVTVTTRVAQLWPSRSRSRCRDPALSPCRTAAARRFRRTPLAT